VDVQHLAQCLVARIVIVVEDVGIEETSHAFKENQRREGTARRNTMLMRPCKRRLPRAMATSAASREQ